MVLKRSNMLCETFVLVTGGASRVGRAITLKLARSGARVLIHANSSVNKAARLAGFLNACGCRADWIQADLSEDEGIQSLCAAIGPDGPFPVNALVHSASPYQRTPLMELDGATLDLYYRVHLKAPVGLAKALAARLMTTADKGRIIHITDASLHRPYAGFCAYLTTKQALDGLTRALAVELAPHILVNAVAPGTVLPPPNCTPEYLEILKRKSPLRTVGQPQDVAKAVEFLLTDRGFMTGSTITVDGGSAMF